jgi:hypothetical protein
MSDEQKKTPEELKKDIQEQLEKVRKQDIGLDADSSSLATDVLSNDDPDDDVLEKPFGSPLDEK